MIDNEVSVYCTCNECESETIDGLTWYCVTCGKEVQYEYPEPDEEDTDNLVNEELLNESK